MQLRVCQCAGMTGHSRAIALAILKFIIKMMVFLLLAAAQAISQWPKHYPIPRFSVTSVPVFAEHTVSASANQ